MKKFILLLSMFALTASAHAFIMEPSVKGAALGSAYIAGFEDDIFAASYNPASQVSSQGQVGGAWHKREHAEQIYSLGLGYNFNYGIAVQGFGNYLYDSDADAKNGEAKIGASISLLKAGINVPVTFGVNLKQGWYNVGDDKENALVGDVGMIIRPVGNLTIGAVYSNIGGKKNLYTDDTYGAGVSYVINMDRKNAFDLRFDIGKEDDHTRWGAGIEYALRNIFALRLGYIDTNYTDNFTFGAGVNLGQWGRIDGAYLPYDHGNKTYKLAFVIPFGVSGKQVTYGGDFEQEEYKPARPVVQEVKQQPADTVTYNQPATITDSDNAYRPYSSGPVDTTYTTQPTYNTTYVPTAATGTTVNTSGNVTNSKYPYQRPQRWMK
ncbi:hypothetical protein AAIR98_001096 [Elusimicrobium simillimum]|uniref:hypothetical protein n=1 Tax=Elusimicrobium simillimum TaxID=3143438 RepID=UPI003C6FC838